MTEPTTYTVTARLCPGADTAALLRVVSILHSRRTNVRQLVFDAEEREGAIVTARVTLSNAGWATLQESLRRPVEVMEVRSGVDASHTQVNGGGGATMSGRRCGHLPTFALPSNA